jgi:hypothetical protein
MQMICSATVEIARPVEEVFAFATGCDNFPAFLVKRGPIPGVVKVEMIGGAPLAAGATRQITLTDGSVLEEVVLALERPSLHRYRWQGGPRPPLSLLVHSGEGEWTFSARAQSTRIEWRYTFELTSPLAYPLALIVLPFLRRWMAGSLRRLRDALGGGPPPG